MLIAPERGSFGYVVNDLMSDDRSARCSPTDRSANQVPWENAGESLRRYS